MPQLEPRSFSFNSPYGACPACNGLGSKYELDPAKVIVDWSKPLFQGALGPGAGSSFVQRTIELASYAHGFNLGVAFEALPKKVQNMILHGYPPKGEEARVEPTNRSPMSRREKKYGLHFQGIFQMLESNFEESKSDTYREWMTQYMSPIKCSVCNERRLRPESLAVKIAGRSISEYVALSISDARPAVDTILKTLTSRQQEIGGASAGRNRRALGFSGCGRARIFEFGSFRGNFKRRRSAAHSAGHANRFAFARRALCFGRTEHRIARAR